MHAFSNATSLLEWNYVSCIILVPSPRPVLPFPSLSLHLLTYVCLCAIAAIEYRPKVWEISKYHNKHADSAQRPDASTRFRASLYFVL